MRIEVVGVFLGSLDFWSCETVMGFEDRRTAYHFHRSKGIIFYFFLGVGKFVEGCYWFILSGPHWDVIWIEKDTPRTRRNVFFSDGMGWVYRVYS